MPRLLILKPSRKKELLEMMAPFINGAIFYPINDELKPAVYEEWDAQTPRMENPGLVPTHAYSHQHTHISR